MSPPGVRLFFFVISLMNGNYSNNNRKRKRLWGVLTVVLALVVLFFLIRSLWCWYQHTQGESCTTKGGQRPEPQYVLDICIDSMEVVEGSIACNQFLSTLLSDYGVSAQTIDFIARNRRNVFDVSKIRGGNHYKILLSNDSLKTPLYWIYQIDQRDFAIFSLTDSLPARRYCKDSELRMARTNGVITSSLWNAIVGGGGDPALAVRLSDIYAWTVDFFGIQEGDAFDVVYEQEYIDSVAVGLGEIYCCKFVHRGDTLWAFRFDQEGNCDYFDENGTSLRKAFLKAPLSYSRISSKFTHSRYHPVLKYYRPHHGVDYAAPAGTPVYSIGDGVVIAKAYQRGGGGNYLKIKHNGTYATCYMHLKGYAKGIAQGVRVRQGQLIGYVGMTGVATGPHLDFRVYKNGTPIDPLKMESPPTDPVPDKDMPRYSGEVKYWRKAMCKEETPERYAPEPDTTLYSAMHDSLEAVGTE